jgi:hypothetical protein
MDPNSAAKVGISLYEAGGFALLLLAIIVAGGSCMMWFFMKMIRDLGAEVKEMRTFQTNKLVTVVEANTEANREVKTELRTQTEILRNLRAGHAAVLIILLPLLGLGGCSHRETAQAAVDQQALLQAAILAKTEQQARELVAKAITLVKGIIARESVGLDAPVVARFTAGEALAATDPDAAPEQRRDLAAHLNDMLGIDLSDLDSKAKSEEVVHQGGNLLVSLLGATAVGGTALALFAKARTAYNSLRTTAQVAVDGWHAAHAVLEDIHPEAAKALDNVSYRAQSHLHPAIKSTLDAMLATADRKPAVMVPDLVAAS